MFARILSASAAACLLATPLAAQSGIPWCERAAGGASVQQAYALLEQGDAILDRLGDCGQVNLMGCEQALALYREAERQIAAVFFEAKGEACTYCDVTAIGDVASELAIRGDHFTQALNWDVNLRGVWDDFQNWRDAPYCDLPASAPPPPTTPAPGPAPGPSPVPAPSGCAFTDETPGYFLPDTQGPDLQQVGPEECRAICDANDWCRSYTVNRAARVCQFHSQTGAEVALQDAFNDQISHFTCLGR